MTELKDYPPYLDLPRGNKSNDTIQSQAIILDDNNQAQAYVQFVDDELLVQVVAGGKQYDFVADANTLQMLAYGYKLHCERLKI